MMRRRRRLRGSSYAASSVKVTKRSCVAHAAARVVPHHFNADGKEIGARARSHGIVEI
jgi:hypothetical protein